MANYFISPNESFVITVPFDVSDQQDPELIFADSIEAYPRALQEVDEDETSFETMTWRKPSWGMDCYLRELAYEGSTVRDRMFSSEKFEQVRLRYLLLDSSFFGEDHKISFIKSGNYDALSPASEEMIKRINPFVLKVFMLVASRVWDLGTPIKSLLNKDDYLTLRNNPDGLQIISKAKGLVQEAGAKKKEGEVDSNEAFEQRLGEACFAATHSGDSNWLGLFYRSAKELWTNFGIDLEKCDRLDPTQARELLNVCSNFLAGEAYRHNEMMSKMNSKM